MAKVLWAREDAALRGRRGFQLLRGEEGGDVQLRKRLLQQRIGGGPERGRESESESERGRGVPTPTNGVQQTLVRPPAFSLPSCDPPKVISPGGRTASDHFSSIDLTQ